MWDADVGATSPHAMLNALGDEGWELVAIIRAIDGVDDGRFGEPATHKGRTFIYYLKRCRDPLPEIANTSSSP